MITQMDAKNHHQSKQADYEISRMEEVVVLIFLGGLPQMTYLSVII